MKEVFEMLAFIIKYKSWDVMLQFDKIVGEAILGVFCSVLVTLL